MLKKSLLPLLIAFHVVASSKSSATIDDESSLIVSRWNREVPPEIMNYIFGYLSPEELIVSAGVCNWWHQCAQLSASQKITCAKWRVLVDRGVLPSIQNREDQFTLWNRNAFVLSLLTSLERNSEYKLTEIPEVNSLILHDLNPHSVLGVIVCKDIFAQFSKENQVNIIEELARISLEHIYILNNYNKALFNDINSSNNRAKLIKTISNIPLSYIKVVLKYMDSLFNGIKSGEKNLIFEVIPNMPFSHLDILFKNINMFFQNMLASERVYILQSLGNIPLSYIDLLIKYADKIFAKIKGRSSLLINSLGKISIKRLKMFAPRADIIFSDDMTGGVRAQLLDVLRKMKSKPFRLTIKYAQNIFRNMKGAERCNLAQALGNISFEHVGFIGKHGKKIFSNVEADNDRVNITKALGGISIENLRLFIENFGKFFTDAHQSQHRMSIIKALAKSKVTNIPLIIKYAEKFFFGCICDAEKKILINVLGRIQIDHLALIAPHAEKFFSEDMWWVERSLLLKSLEQMPIEYVESIVLYAENYLSGLTKRVDSYFVIEALRNIPLDRIGIIAEKAKELFVDIQAEGRVALIQNLGKKTRPKS